MGFLQYINQILSTGEVSKVSCFGSVLFPKDEIDSILDVLRPVAKKAN
jgi:hypothetical protein